MEKENLIANSDDNVFVHMKKLGILFLWAHGAYTLFSSSDAFLRNLQLLLLVIAGVIAFYFLSRKANDISQKSFFIVLAIELLLHPFIFIYVIVNLALLSIAYSGV